MADTLFHLLCEQEQARARVCGAAQNALWFLQVQGVEDATKILKSALDNYNVAARNILEFYKRTLTEDSRTAA